MPSGTNGAETHSEQAPGSLYYRGSAEPGENPSASQEYIERMQETIVAVWDNTNPLPIGSGLLIYWNERLLTAIAPDDVVGRFRRLGEASVYDLWEDTPDGRRYCHMEGLRVASSGHGQIAGAVSKACEEFIAAIAMPPRTVTAAVAPPAKLYVALLQIRPFPMANDPIAYLALTAAYRRVGLQWPGPGLVPRGPGSVGVEFNRAIARSLQPNSPTLESLIEFLAAKSSFIE
jgi:hypothetical protein